MKEIPAIRTQLGEVPSNRSCKLWIEYQLSPDLSRPPAGVLFAIGGHLASVVGFANFLSIEWWISDVEIST